MTEAADTFLGYLTEADRLVRAQYPEAQFYEADLANTAPGGQWRFVFNDPSSTPNGTVIIERLERGFGEPHHIGEPWVEDRIIPLPISLGLEEARSLCKAHGCGGEVGAITLRWPLYPGVNEPYYILAMPAENRRCWVGVNSREVRCEPIEGA
jgi:hypothetical protein